MFEGSFKVTLVNARHVENVPGRKTDAQDGEWLCILLRSALVRGSFIPPRDIRDLRDLKRYKRKLIQTIVSNRQRVKKVLEDSNIKLSSMVSDTCFQSIIVNVIYPLCSNSPFLYNSSKSICSTSNLRGVRTWASSGLSCWVLSLASSPS